MPTQPNDEIDQLILKFEKTAYLARKENQPNGINVSRALKANRSEAREAIQRLIVEARIDEQRNTFIGRLEPKAEIWVLKEGVGHLSITQDERLVELQTTLNTKQEG